GIAQTLVSIVVKNQKIPQLFLANAQLAINLIGQGAVSGAAWKVLNKNIQAGLHHINTGGLQWLQKAACKPDTKHIFIPGPLAHAGGERNQFGFRQWFALELLLQERKCLIVAHKTTAIDMAVTHSMLQGNAPLPACGCGQRAGEYRRGLLTAAGQGDSAIAR